MCIRDSLDIDRVLVLILDLTKSEFYLWFRPRKHKRSVYVITTALPTKTSLKTQKKIKLCRENNSFPTKVSKPWITSVKNWDQGKLVLTYFTNQQSRCLQNILWRCLPQVFVGELLWWGYNVFWKRNKHTVFWSSIVRNHEVSLQRFDSNSFLSFAGLFSFFSTSFCRSR